MMFNQALKFALVWEGGDKITSDPDDAGGLTKYGISQRAHPELDIANLTEEQAGEIYRAEYWVPGGCDSLPSPVNRVHFDACVNHGIRQANKLLQRAAGANDDGAIGPQTLSAVQAMDPHLLAIAMITERNRYYQAIVENKSSQAKYLRGWLNRTKALMDSLI